MPQKLSSKVNLLYFCNKMKIPCFCRLRLFGVVDSFFNIVSEVLEGLRFVCNDFDLPQRKKSGANKFGDLVHYGTSLNQQIGCPGKILPNRFIVLRTV